MFPVGNRRRSRVVISAFRRFALCQTLIALLTTARSARHAAADVRHAESHDALQRARAALAEIDTGLADARIKAPPVGAISPTAHRPPPTAHRSAHRPGVQAKLDGDPEVRAVVLARIDRMTYRQIADEVALQFPVERHVKRSAAHTWWQTNNHRHA